MEDQRTPTLQNVFRRYIDRMMKSLYTMMPGKVISYDAAKQRATVQPLFRMTIPGAQLDAETTEADVTEVLQPLKDIPVWWLRTKTAYIYLPLKAGDFVMLLFSMASMEKWLVSGSEEPVDPQDTRHHTLSDAVAVPGLFPFTSPIPEGDIDDDDIRIINNHPTGGRTEIYLGGDTGDVVIIPARDVRLGDKDSTEQVLLGNKTIQYIITHTHPTLAGPSSAPTQPMPEEEYLSPNIKVKGGGV